MTMKIEITEVERHALLAMLGPKPQVEWKLHGHDKTRGWDAEALYQKILNPPEPTYWVERWVDYEGGYRAAEGTAAEVVEFLKKQKSYDIEDMDVHVDEGSVNAQEFLNAHMPK